MTSLLAEYLHKNIEDKSELMATNIWVPMPKVFLIYHQPKVYDQLVRLLGPFDVGPCYDRSVALFWLTTQNMCFQSQAVLRGTGECNMEKQCSFYFRLVHKQLSKKETQEKH